MYSIRRYSRRWVGKKLVCDVAVTPDGPEGRILASIVAGQWPWACLVDVALREAEHSGPAGAADALARLEAGGYIARWDLPAVPGKKAPDRKKGEAQGQAASTQVTLTPWAVERLGCGAVGASDRIDLLIVEDETERAEWYGWDGQLPREYRLPPDGRTYHMSDPRMAATVASLGTTRGEDDEDADEYMMDRQTGEVAMLFGQPVAIASSWSKAAKASARLQSRRTA